MKKHILSSFLVVIIASGLIIAGAYAYKEISPKKMTPAQVTLAFYEDWLDYETNPLSDKVYQDSPYLTSSLKEEIDQVVASFEYGAFDPVLCAQEKPDQVQVLDTTIQENQAVVLIENSYSGSGKLIEVELINDSKNWKINKIICQEGERGADSINANVSPAIQTLVSGYLRDHISELSPEKEVLGGSFMITSLDFISPTVCLVDYEDGHIDLTARVEFRVPRANEVKIESFDIIKDNEAIFSKTGNVVKQGDEWYLVYEEPGKPALKKQLLFDDSSQCPNERLDKSCFPSYWQVGDRAQVDGWLEADVIKVRSFKIVGEVSKNINNNNSEEITSFEDCLRAGNEVLYPDCIDCLPYCETESGVRFEQLSMDNNFCEDLCGNGICEEVVCMAEGCPCPETTASCPADCQ